MAPARPTPTFLADLRPGVTGVVRSIALEAAEGEWLRAVGLFEGTEVTLLRRAPLGGPLHLRTSTGAEIAIDRGLARAVEVAIEAAG